MESFEIKDTQVIGEEILRTHEEDEEFIIKHVNILISECLDDFPDVDADQADRDAAEITRAAITDATRNGHKRIIKAYIAYHLRRQKGWDARAVTPATPQHIIQFIHQKCGQREAGYEGKKYSTAVSTRAALSFWYHSVRPQESTVEWRVDPVTQNCSGLPTRSREVSRFMIGLERTKARAGEVSQSACALTLDDMLNLWKQIFDPSRPRAEIRQGIVRWAVYLIAWLAVLRIEEALSLDFGNIEMNPNQRQSFKVYLKPRKSAQTGETRTWYLWANDREPRICPVRALIQLACLYRGNINYSGPLFLKVDKFGAVQEGVAMTSGMLSRALATDLQRLGYQSWSLYGTHSFRRGGTQYRIRNQRWSPDMVAAWGGWTQAEATTMFRYFYSPNDNHEYLAEYDRNS